MREEVSKKFGDDFLLQHEVNQLDSSVMELIKSKYLPNIRQLPELTKNINTKNKIKPRH